MARISIVRGSSTSWIVSTSEAPANQRKEGKSMFKRFIRWILPLLVLLLIATYLLVSPVLATHAASVAPAPITAPQSWKPGIFWRNH